MARKQRAKKPSRKRKTPRGYQSWMGQVTAERKSWRFERRPSFSWGGDTSTHTVEKKGRISSSRVVIDRDIRGNRKLLEVVTKHELRENLAFQNFASKREAHRYAVRHEARDLRKLGLSKKEYRRLTREAGYNP